MTLTEFLLTRYADEEAEARRAEEWGVETPEGPKEFFYDVPPAEWWDHFELWVPTRVLADIGAKRRIVESVPYRNHDGADNDSAYEQWEATLRLLAQPYVDHPDFDPAWRL